MNRTLIALSAGFAILCGTTSRADVIYVAEEELPRISVVQSNGVHSPLVDGLWMVYGLTVDSQGNLYAASAGNDTIYQITPAKVVSAYASGTTLGSPGGLAFDGSGNLFTTGYGWGGTVNRIAPDRTITRVANGIGGDGLAFDGNGDLYVAGHATVTKLAPNGTATTVASGFQLAWGLAFDHAGNLYVADYLANTISRITPAGTVSLFVTGLDRPSGLAFDSHGDLYVCNITATQPLGYLSRITPAGTVSTFATGFDYPTAIAIRAEPPVTPTNRPPFVQCTNVTVVAGDDGLAQASVDNGSFDPDNDPITVTQTPPGPYPLGTNQVLLTVTDDKGASDSCVAMVTVLDEIPPVILSAEASPAILWPPNHRMVPVRVTASVTDNSRSATWKIVSVQCNEQVNGRGSGHTAPDWIITGDHTVRLRAERSGNGPERAYSITLKATDPSGNASSAAVVTVRVPKSTGRRK